MVLKIDNKKVERFLALVGEARNVLILAHKNPDGDAVGSMLGLAALLKKHGGYTDERLSLLLPGACPESLAELPGFERCLFGDKEMERCKEAFERADLVIGVDFNDTNRVGCLQPLLEAARQPKIMIDHHWGPNEQAFNLVISFADLSSTCELVYWFGYHAWGEEAFDQRVATCLYSGICTDTGSFAFSNSSPTLYTAASHLVATGITPAAIYNNLFNDYTENKLRFFAFCLSERMRMFADKGFAYMYVSKADMERFQVSYADTEGLVNYLLKMRHVRVGVLLKEMDGIVRLNFRSKGPFEVNTFSQKHFGGGGHKLAAGGESSLSLDATCLRLEQTLLPLL